MKFVKEFVKDLVTLKRPVTAAAVAGVLVTALAPFHPPSAEGLAGILVGIGTLAAALEKLRAVK